MHKSGASLSRIGAHGSVFKKTTAYDFAPVQEQSIAPVPLATFFGKEQSNLFEDNALDAQQAECFEALIDMACDAPTAHALLEGAVAQGYTLMLACLESDGYELDTHNHILYLDNFGMEAAHIMASDYYKGQVFIALIRGLRDIWHEGRMAQIHDVLQPEYILKIERFRAADIEAVTAHILWQMRIEGYNELWRSLIADRDGDIAVAYMQVAEKGSDRLVAAKALSAAFRQWFSDAHRCTSCDHVALDIMDGRLSEKGEAAGAFGRHGLNAEQLIGLMSLPPQSAGNASLRYLCLLKDNLLNDPFYAGYFDDINQAHFFHILRDLEGIRAGGIAFQSPDLAAKLFPKENKRLL